jgi:DNA polymerase-3 subunit alpha
MLSDVKDEMIKMVNITIPLNEINDTLVDDIKKQAESNKGKIQLKFRVFDPESKISIDLFSRTMKVNLSQKFLTFLQKNDFEFKLKE